MPITGLRSNNFSSDASDLTAIRNLLGLGTASDPAFRTLGLSGQSLTGSQATSLASLSATWNTTGTPTLIDANVTDTASNANSLLMNLRRNGTTAFSVQKNGNLTASGTITSSQSISAVSVVTCGNVAALHNSGWSRPRGIGIAMGWNGGLFFTDTLDVFGTIRAMVSSPSDGVVEINSGVVGTLRDLSLRSITGSGNINFASLPTSDPGVPGRVWRSGADLKVSV